MSRRKGISREAAVVFFAFALCAAAFSAGPDMREYLETPDEYGSVIPDFSHAGYMGGGVSLPDVPVVKELSPLPAGDDRERIQAALDAISEMAPGEDGFRGALLLRAGDYRVDGYLHIRGSGVVLRGEGQFEGGTTITATKLDYVLPGRIRQHSLIYLGRHDGSRAGFLTKENETLLASEAVPVGSREIRVRNTDGFRPGDDIVVEVYPNTAWLETLDLAESWAGKARGTRTRFYYERTITGISGNKMTLDAPMTFYLDDNLLHGALVWSYSEDDRISRSGVENLRLKSYFNSGNYTDMRNYMEVERHAWSGIRVEPVRDCWVRNVTALYFQHAAVEVHAGARNVTVQDCAYLRPVSRVAGSRRYAFRTEGTRILMQRNYSRGARHAFASSSAGLGLNVFLDSVEEDPFGESGPHLKWAVGYLYDNIAAPRGRIEVNKRGPGHGWAGVNQVLWNCRAGTMICDEPETPDRNWNIGAFACKSYSTHAPSPYVREGTWISHGEHVSPRSLYLYQLEERLGRRAVENITVEEQMGEDSEAIHRLVKEKLADLTEFERANEGNILRDPGFMLPDSQPWTLASGEGVKTLERAVNPVFGDESAVVVPADDLMRYRYNSITVYPSTKDTDYRLSFDYKLPEGEELSPMVNYLVRKYFDEEELEPGDSRGEWQGVEAFRTDTAEGSGEWERYSFEFTLSPVIDEKSGMPYCKIIFIRFFTDGEMSFANPFLEEI